MNRLRITYQKEGIDWREYTPMGFGLFEQSPKFYINFKELNKPKPTQEQIMQDHTNQIIENMVFGKDYDPMIHDACQPSKSRIIGRDI